MTRTSRAATAVKVLAAAVVLSHACIAVGGSTSAGVTIRATILPTRAQALRTAQISVRQLDGTLLVLNSQQQAQYILQPDNSLRNVRDVPGGDVLVTVHY